MARDLRFDEELTILEDLDFLVRLLREGEIVHVEETLVDLYESGYVSADVEERAREAFLDKHAGTVAALEREGHPVTGVHAFYLAKACFRDGRFGAGVDHLGRATVPGGRQLAALAWSGAVGLGGRLG